MAKFPELSWTSLLLCSVICHNVLRFFYRSLALPTHWPNYCFTMTNKDFSRHFFSWGFFRTVIQAFDTGQVTVNVFQLSHALFANLVTNARLAVTLSLQTLSCCITAVPFSSITNVNNTGVMPPQPWLLASTLSPVDALLDKTIGSGQHRRR